MDREWTRSDGLLIASFGDGYAVHDRIEHRVSIVTDVAGRVLLSPTPTTESVSAELIAAFDLDTDERAELPAALGRIVDDLRSAGLVDRPPAWTPPEAISVGDPNGPDPAAVLGSTVSMIGRTIGFRSTDRRLLDDIATSLHLADGPSPDARPEEFIDVEPNNDGGLDVHAAEEWNFPDRSGFHIQLPGLLNDLAPRLTARVVLHAGGVRTPDGRVIVLPGRSEAGKSTLTAALVSAGCDFLGDELMGIEPDTLRVLGSPRSPALDDQS